jgi:PAS domain S-box-containing protein
MEATGQANGPIEILIVEDSPTQAKRLQHILERQGYVVRHAADGRQALDSARQQKPMLVVSDVIMPEMDGYELCAQLKADPSLGDLPVILVTTLSDPSDVIRGLECRADNFILKPYEERYLVSRVQFVLLNRQMRQTEQGGLAVEIFFNGQRHVITADRLQILNLLLSTYDAAIQRNKELTRAEEDTRRAESFLNSIIENVPSTIFVKQGPELRYVRLNRAFEDLVGRPRSEVLGKTDYDLFPEEEAAFFTAKDREALDRRMLIDVPDAPVHTATRGVRLLHTRKLPILDGSGEAQYLLGITEDVTERRASEQALAAAKLEAERANRAKSEFLSRMSHDLRTPLNAILGFAQLLEMDTLDAEQREGVRHILKGGAHLLDLINEVLDIARIEAGRLSLSPEPVAVAEIVQQAVELVRPLAAQRSITFDDETVRMDASRHVMADRQRLKQILLNLMSNAVKYNREGGRVRVTCSTGPEGRTRINVSDTGAGIPAEKLPLLFQPFERLGAEQTVIEGTGLGLMLSKGLAEAMGGTLGVESAVDRGSTFWVELARAEATVETVSAPIAARPDATHHDSGVTGTVLYIEDNISNRRLMERVLARRAGVRLLGAAQGQTGLDLARTHRPDLILLDLHLPDLPGEEVLRRLWEDSGTRAIPVAVLSADATPAQTRRLIAAGATAYLTKPINIGEVLQLLDEKLQKHD